VRRRFHLQRRSSCGVFGLFFYHRPALANPLPDCFLIALPRTPGRTLQRPIKPMEDSPYVPRVVSDAAKPLDHRGNSRKRPQACPKPMSLRPKTERGIYLAQLLGVQSRFASRSPRGLEPPDPSFEKIEKPSAYTLAADVKRSRNFRLSFARFKQPSRSGASLFHAFEVSPWPKNFALCSSHSPRL